MNIDIYWHVFLVNHWRDIVNEQINLIQKAGLYDACVNLYISAIDPDGRLPEFAYFLEEGPKPWKAILVSCSSNPEDYEFPAIQRIYYDSIRNATSDIVVYMHSKGVSYPDDSHRPWREVCHEMIKHWKQCVEALYPGKVLSCEVAGVNYLQGHPGRWPQHFSGNFWMARRSYIASLQPPLKSQNRFEAEWWILSGNPQIYALPFIEHGCISA